MKMMTIVLMAISLIACAHSNAPTSTNTPLTPNIIPEELAVYWACHVGVDGGYWDSNSTGHYDFYKDGTFLIRGTKIENFGESEEILFHWTSTGQWAWKGANIEIKVVESRMLGYTTTKDNSEAVHLYADELAKTWAAYKETTRLIQVMSLDAKKIVFLDPVLSVDNRAQCRSYVPRPAII